MFFFFFNDTATTEIYTLSLHDALPISLARSGQEPGFFLAKHLAGDWGDVDQEDWQENELSQVRSEEHTSELQSLAYLVCRLLLEKKKRSRCSARRSHAS